MTKYALVGDVGGTNARLALCDVNSGEISRAKTYSGLDYTDGAPTGTLLTDVLDSYLRARSPLAPDNEPRQRIE